MGEGQALFGPVEKVHGVPRVAPGGSDGLAGSQAGDRMPVHAAGSRLGRAACTQTMPRALCNRLD